ncbi:Peptidase A1 domain-containing protein [Meloidogyne graminicola]|uniref:Peptidase A1 domain-containing protein n=1 Tax=Meloidogyne graminicola TaxID=189291 RepID=A0A8S9Z814_9BILA|nr:Peptidase A1 domain-containing protein [Meloidogyne graminicola]
MNSFLNAKIIYGKGENATEFNVIFDSILNIIEQPGNFLIGTCPNKMKNSKGKNLSCNRHKMKILSPEKAKCGNIFEQITLDNTTINIRICEDNLEFGGQQNNNSKLILIDGDKFDKFDGILDSGAKGSPNSIDGVFSLAYSDKDYLIKSGAEYLIEEKQEEPIISIYMEKFKNLNFFSGTKGTLNFGLINKDNCVYWGNPLNLIEGSRRWKIKMEVNKILNETKEILFKDQEVMISTTDIFIFAPENFTKPIMDKLSPVKDNRFFKLLRKIGMSGLSPKDVMIKCPTDDEYKQLPTINLNFGEKSFIFEPKDYIMPLVTKLPIIKKNVKVFNWCHMLIRSRPDPAMFARNLLPQNNKNQWILGQVFFNKACVAFNYKDNTVNLGDAWTQEN